MKGILSTLQPFLGSPNIAKLLIIGIKSASCLSVCDLYVTALTGTYDRSTTPKLCQKFIGCHHDFVLSFPLLKHLRLQQKCNARIRILGSKIALDYGCSMGAFEFFSPNLGRLFVVQLSQP